MGYTRMTKTPTKRGVTSRVASNVNSAGNAQMQSSKKKRAAIHEHDPAIISPRSAKRKRTVATAASGRVDVVDLTSDGSPRKKAKADLSSLGEVTERRARRFRTHPPNSYLEKLARATTQRMYVVGRTRTSSDAAPEEKVDIVGTTGNIYQVTIGKEPTCSCPDAQKGNMCKHVIYVLVNVLKAPEHLQYQLAFLSSEVREIFQGAPLNSKENSSAEDTSGKRKPIDGDCPICFMEFDPKTDEIVWCKAACGNNVHKVCFQQWAVTQRANGVRCVYCRSDWQADEEGLELSKLLRNGRSTTKDISTSLINWECLVNAIIQHTISLGYADDPTIMDELDATVRFSQYFLACLISSLGV